MRPLNTLYQIVLKNFLPRRGICNAIINTWVLDHITRDEYYVLKAHFETTRPTFFTKAYWHPAYDSKGGYWWARNNIGDVQRKKHIQSLINKLS